MLKFQEATKCVSGPIALSAYPKTLIARRYVVQQKLGSGSFGTVYLVSDKKAKQGEELYLGVAAWGLVWSLKLGSPSQYRCLQWAPALYHDAV
uniref:NIMA related kinase 11 n=1 Tax=Panthera leo TaxID=9689 RepID=A0A8C8XFS1_PANLE